MNAQARCPGTCRAGAGEACFARKAASPRLCTLAGSDPHYRRFVRERSGLDPGPPIRPARGFPAKAPPRDLLGLVRGCPERGPVLPLSLQDASGCCGGGPELTGCRAGLGRKPGRVTLRECLACVEARDPVVFRAEASTWTSYGRIARSLALALEDLGIPVAYRASLRQKDGPQRDPWVEAREGLGSGRDWYLQFQEPFSGDGGPGRKVSFSMNESDTLAPPSRAAFQRAELVILPCRTSRDAFIAGGVDPARIRLVPLGLCDAGAFSPRDSTREGPPVFGMAGRQMHGIRRKNFAAGIAAFRRAFPAGESALLKILTSDDLAVETHGDPRIVVERRVTSASVLGDWYRGLDALLVPSRGEGWGMHTHEGMACGVPPIAALWGGAGDLCDASTCYPVAFSLSACDRDLLNSGRWCEPSVASMADAMRRVAADRPGAFEVGRRASVRAHALSWEASARALLAALAEFGFATGREC